MAMMNFNPMMMMGGMQQQQGQMGQGGCGCQQEMGQNFGLQGFPNMPSMMPMPMPMPNYGGNYGGNGNGNYGGGNYGGGWPMSSGPMTDIGSMSNSSPMGNRLLSSIRNNPTVCQPGYCYRGVKSHLRSAGVNLQGGSAYQAADQLAQNPRFREVRVSRNQLKSLPAGAVVVWDRDGSNRSSGGGKQHGHISISTGDGREASDKVRNQMTNYGPRYRVFIPSDNGGAQNQPKPRHVQA